jgi:hypothetical protein
MADGVLIGRKEIKGNVMMATDSSQHIGLTESIGVMTRVGEQLRRFVCGLHGHDSLLHFGDGRVSLLCSSCGHETPGWDVKSKPARPHVVRQEPRVVRMPFVGERRVA